MQHAWCQKLETDWTLDDCLKFKVESKVTAVVADVSGPFVIQDFFLVSSSLVVIMRCLDVWIQIFSNNLWYAEQCSNIRAAIFIQHLGCLNIEKLVCNFKRD